MDEIKAELGEIKLTLAVLSEKLDNAHKRFRENVESQGEEIAHHRKIIEGENGLVSKISTLINSLKNHSTVDIWAFGLIFTALILIFGKLIHG